MHSMTLHFRATGEPRFGSLDTLIRRRRIASYAQGLLTMIQNRFNGANCSAVLVVTLVWLAFGSGTRRPFAVAQELDSLTAVEDVEDVELSESEVDSSDNEALEDLFDIRRELKEELAQLEADAKHTQRRIEFIDRIVSLTRQANKIEKQTEHADQTVDDAEARKIGNRYERLETELSTNKELLELEQEIAEYEHALELRMRMKIIPGLRH